MYLGGSINSSKERADFPIAIAIVNEDVRVTLPSGQQAHAGQDIAAHRAHGWLLTAGR